MIPSKEDVASFRRYSRIFAMLTAYLDESYYNRTFCVGGWVLRENKWSAFERDWDKCIEQERQSSISRGFPPISRYHASDCSSLQNEFDETKGWDVGRQIKLSKRLLGIIVKHRPHGVVIGGSVDLFVKHFPEDKNRWRKALYYYSIALVMNELNEIRKAHYPDEKITIFYDRGKLSSMAAVAFHSLKNDSYASGEDLAPYFVTMAPLGWEDCILLQAADLLAFEGMKRVDGHIAGNTVIRRSFAELLGKKVDMGVAGFTDAYFTELKKAKLKYIEGMGQNESQP
jgi:hypothetical protein